jgi:hypothetical protein
MAITRRKRFSADFTQESCNLGLLKGATAVVAVSDNAVNVYQLSKPDHFLELQNTAQNDIKVPVVAATGWTLPLDNANDDAIEGGGRPAGWDPFEVWRTRVKDPRTRKPVPPDDRRKR